MSEPTFVHESDYIDVSVIIPVFNERENLAVLLEETRAALSTIEGLSSEVVFVDDGSTDGSRETLREAAARYPDLVRVVEFRRNYGQTAALDSGIRVAQGRVLVLMDADRQNDPADIPRLLAGIAEGADVVSGWRRRRHDPFLSRRLPSLVANRIITRLTRVPIHDFGCMLKAYRREVLAPVQLYGEMHRFLPAYAAWHGAKVVEVEVNHRPRVWGRSHYRVTRMVRVVLDLMTVLFLQGSYASKPLHVFGNAGVALILGSLFLAGFVLYEKTLFPVQDPRHIFVHRNPLASLSALTLILGLGAFALGLLAELITRVYHATADVPYTISGYRNVPGRPTPEETRGLSRALQGLARPSAGPGGSPAAGPAASDQRAR